MNHDVAQVLSHLGWPTSVPSLDGLSLQLRLNTVARLSEMGILLRYHRACEDVWNEHAALCPFLSKWASQGMLVALARAVL